MDEIIREAFFKSGLSIRALTLRAGTPYGATYRFLHGQGGVTLVTGSKLAAALDLELCPRRRKAV